MNKENAFMIADFMVQVNKKIFNKEMSSKKYIKDREMIMKKLMEKK